MSLSLSKDSIAVYGCCVSHLESHPELGKIFFQISTEIIEPPLRQLFVDIERHFPYKFPNHARASEQLFSMAQGKMHYQLSLGYQTYEELYDEEYIRNCIQIFLKAHEETVA